jgi:hypothetical protein
MPVIGRLDEQVNEVLITPLERGREPQPPPAPGAPEAAPTPPEPVDDGHAGETSRARVELPVWLL